jgi:sugar phosphate isomerase/epimerase
MRAAGIARIEICAISFGGPEDEEGHLDFGSPAHISEVTSECEKQGVSIVAMHSPNYAYLDPDDDVRKRAVARGVVAAKVSEEMGAGVMVCHIAGERLCYGTDVQTEKSVTEMLRQLEDHSIRLTIENGKDLAGFADFVDKIGSAQLGMTVDIGHTRDEDGINPFVKKDRARETMAQCGKWLFHVHLHDFWAGQDHIAPMDGDIQWDEVLAAFKDIDYQGSLMFEAAYPPAKPPVESPDYLISKVASFPTAFVERYVRPRRAE